MGCGDAGPGVGAKWRGRQAGAVVEIRNRIVGPRVTNRNRLQHLRTPNDHRIAINPRLGPHKPPVLTGNRKPLNHSTIARLQPTTILKPYSNLLTFNREPLKQRPRRNNLLAISPSQRPRREPAPNIDLITRMNIILIANIDRHRHPSLRLAQRHRLRLTQLSPITLIRLSLARMPVRKLHKVERKLMPPRTSPVTNHDRKQRAVLISASGVTLALVPDRATNRERHERRNHRVVKHTRIVLITNSNRFRTRTPIRMLRLEREFDFVIPRSA